MPLDLEFADRVLNEAVKRGNSQEEVQKHLDSLDPVGQEQFINEAAQAFGMARAPQDQTQAQLDRGMTLERDIISPAQVRANPRLAQQAPAAPRFGAPRPQDEALALGAADVSGFGEELAPVSAAVEKGIGFLTDKFRKEPLYDRSIPELAEETRGEFAQAQERNPGSFTAGKLGASMALGAGTNVAGVLPNAALGAIQGAGEGNTFQERATNAVIGGVIGGALGALSPQTAKGAIVAGKSLQETAEEMSVGVLKLPSGRIEKLGEDKLRKLGHMLLDEKVTNSPVTLKTVGKKIGDLRKATGGELDDTMREMIKELPPGAMLNKQDLGELIQTKLASEQFTDSEAISATMKQLQDFLRKIPEDAALSLDDIWKLAQKFDRISNRFGRSTNPLDLSRSDMLSKVSDGLREFIDLQAGRLGKADVWRAASGKYRLLKEAETGVRKQLLSRFKPTSFKPGVMATAVDKAFKTQPVKGRVINVTDMLGKVLQSPKRFGKFENTLMKAAQKGQLPLATTHYVLMQSNQDYREMIEKEESREPDQESE